MIQDYERLLTQRNDPERVQRLRVLEHFVNWGQKHLDTIGCVGTRFDEGLYVYRLADGREVNVMTGETITPLNSTGQMQESAAMSFGADAETQDMARRGIAAERAALGQAATQQTPTQF